MRNAHSVLMLPASAAVLQCFHMVWASMAGTWITHTFHERAAAWLYLWYAGTKPGMGFHNIQS